MRGVGVGVGVTTGVIKVRTGVAVEAVLVEAVLSGCVAGCGPLRRLERELFRGLVVRALSLLATCSGGLSASRRAWGDDVVVVVVVGGVLFLAVLTGCEFVRGVTVGGVMVLAVVLCGVARGVGVARAGVVRAGVGVGEAAATTVAGTVLDSGARAGASRRALSNSLS